VSRGGRYKSEEVTATSSLLCVGRILDLREDKDGDNAFVAGQPLGPELLGESLTVRISRIDIGTGYRSVQVDSLQYDASNGVDHPNGASSGVPDRDGDLAEVVSAGVRAA
jgi:hypothetical protein